MMSIRVFASAFITLMFFLSGFHKILGFTDTSKSLVKKTGVSLSLAKLVIFAVIVLELIAPSIITVYFAMKQPNRLQRYAQLSTIALLIFTVAATLLYHFPPTGSNYYSAMSNMSTIGGLILLYTLI